MLAFWDTRVRSLYIKNIFFHVDFSKEREGLFIIYFCCLFIYYFFGGVGAGVGIEKVLKCFITFKTSTNKW